MSFLGIEWKRAWLTVLGVAVVAGGLGLAVGKAADVLDVKALIADTMAKMKQGARKDESWTPFATSLHRLEYKRLNIPTKHESWGGGIATLGDVVLFTQGNGEFGYFTQDTAPVLLPALPTPINFDEIDKAPVGKQDNYHPDIHIRLNDLLVLPRADGNSDLLASHHYYDVKNACFEIRVSRAVIKAVGGKIEVVDPKWEPLFHSTPCIKPEGPEGREAIWGNVFGGRMIKLDEDHILLTLGEQGDPKRSQDPNITLGKYIKLNTKDKSFEMYATGTRNGQGLFMAPDGTIWETEHGPAGGDELNIVKKGANYGWPERTLGVEYFDEPWPYDEHKGRHDSYEPPVFSWAHSIGVSNLVMADERQFPYWKGDLLVLSLVDGHLHRLRLDGQHVLYDESIELAHDRLRDVATLADGSLALLTDGAGIVLVRDADLATKPGSGAIAAAEPVLSEIETKGQGIFREYCANCHNLLGSNGAGPHLDGVVDRKVGSVAGFAYSDALSGKGFKWNHDRLVQFLQDPQKDMPGTRMAASGLKKEDAEAVAAYLKTKK